MDNGLSPASEEFRKHGKLVLILIVMDNGLSRCTPWNATTPRPGLNPYCNG